MARRKTSKRSTAKTIHNDDFRSDYLYRQTLVTKMWPILLALGGICPSHGHQPLRENEGQRPDKNSP